ncbi:DUF5988 family protein [Actinomadura madurae]|uniref:DUF5988 family protein n=1 Tax=Actinomadura madurae TaxID=1993 RepID=UPI0020262AD3|nr:DUF5988 family protein [Actinomadura madurae]MCP9955775.1 DUF5988 family protein [Actinomadura madurae]MCP9972513.1 DUF5988 family protein [Actinomadura madurae]MCP9985009.1 DUF5988 family protein [Actinomadura madurae]MCQ0003418.1 DUF5988 family protein [Actinomadura madurae]MCQ0021230.1 DUF5988 family protein [Actinomadura madurae]
MKQNGAPNIFLSGGPPSRITGERQLHYIADLDVPKVKIPFGNRYEHFEASSETMRIDDRELRVFVWTHSTYVAE